MLSSHVQFDAVNLDKKNTNQTNFLTLFGHKMTANKKRSTFTHYHLLQSVSYFGVKHDDRTILSHLLRDKKKAKMQ